MALQAQPPAIAFPRPNQQLETKLTIGRATKVMIGDSCILGASFA